MSRQTALATSEPEKPVLVRSEPHSLVESGQRFTVAPACDVYESDDELLVIADVPGVTSDGLNVELDKGELVVAARRDVSVGAGSIIGVEYRDCDFRRRFVVPGGIDANSINAELKDGVLRLHLPKSEARKPRQIAVRAG